MRALHTSLTLSMFGYFGGVKNQQNFEWSSKAGAAKQAALAAGFFVDRYISYLCFNTPRSFFRTPP